MASLLIPSSAPRVDTQISLKITVSTSKANSPLKYQIMTSGGFSLYRDRSLFSLFFVLFSLQIQRLTVTPG